MPIRSEPLRPALTRCPGPMIAASISPAISAATAKGLRGIKMNCMSRPCFLNNPRSRATHTAVMLSLVTLDDKFDLTWAFKNCGPQRVANSTLARNRQGYARKALRIITEPIDGSSAKTLASTDGSRLNDSQRRRAKRTKKLRVPGNSIARFFTQGYGDRKAVFGNIEIVTIGVRTASLGIGPSVRARFRQFVGIDLLHALDDLLATFDLETEMVETIGGILFMVRENGEVEVTVGEKDGATLFLALVQHLHLKDIHIKLRQFSRILRTNGQMF